MNSYTTLSIKKDVLQALKIYAAKHGISMNKAILKLLEEAQ